jgi:hypothetical protein
MKIRKIDTTQRKDVQTFIDLPFTLYEGCDPWVPPLVSGVRLSMNRRRYPYYRHSDADFFLAERDGEAVGRVAVLENRRYNDYHQARVAFFYYFDAVDDAEVAHGLFDAAARWAHARGLTRLMGPKGFLRSDAVGLLVEGFEHRAAMGMPYNHAYYPDLLEAAGFEKEVDYLSGYLKGHEDLSDRFYRLAEKIRARRGFWVKSFKNKRELRAWIPRIQQVNNEAFTDVWGYYPIDAAEAQMIARQLLTVADPKLMKVVMKDDEIAGFAFVYPDISEALKEVRGRLWPFGWMALLIARQRTRRMSGNGVGLLPKYQGLGASAVLYVELAKTLKAAKATHCDLAQAMETNVKSLGDMNALGVHWYKRHRVYRRALAEGGDR